MVVVIVGTSVAGVRTAQALRMQGFGDPVVLVGEEPHLPYDKPPLSKELLLGTDGEAPALVASDELAALDVDLRTGVRAIGLDVASHRLTTDAGEIDYDSLVIATGARARVLPGTGDLGGVHTLRNVEDALALRQGLADGGEVVVIGAGFIGAEFASAAHHHGTAVTLVEVQASPLAHLLGTEVGRRLAEVHTAAGHRLLTGVGVCHLEGTDRVEAVVLTDGRRLPADLVLVGIGATPATEWLEGSGVPLDDGVVCDASLRVVGVDGVYAAGDVARWPHPHYGEHLRIEHWTNANEHAGLVAAGITGGRPPAAQVPYVWSDQYGHRIQIVGRPADGELAHVTGSLADGDLVAAYAAADGALAGAVVVDDPRLLMKCRKTVTRRRPWTELDLAPVATRL